MLIEDMTTEEKLAWFKARRPFKEFVTTVLDSYGYALKLPDELIDNLPSKYDKLAMDYLKTKLNHVNGMWERK